MNNLKAWARTVSSNRTERELIIEMEHLLLRDHPEARKLVGNSAASTVSQVAARQGQRSTTPPYGMWRSDRSAAAFTAYFAWGMLALALNLAVISLPIALAIKPILPFDTVVMVVAICGITALPASWLSEMFRMRAALINLSPTALFVSYVVLNIVSLAFILAYFASQAPPEGNPAWPAWPLALAAAAAGNALLARWGRNNQRALEEDLARHRSAEESVWDARKRPIDRIVASGFKRSRAALATLSPQESEALIATRSAALDVLVSRQLFSSDLADALRLSLPGTALITFASVRVELGIE